MRRYVLEWADADRGVAGMSLVSAHAPDTNGRDGVPLTLRGKHDKKPLIAVRDHGPCKHLIFPENGAMGFTHLSLHCAFLDDFPGFVKCLLRVLNPDP